MAKPGPLKMGVEILGVKEMGKALKAVGDTEAPFVTEALEWAGPHMVASAKTFAPNSSIANAISFIGVKGKGIRQRAVVRAKHPAGASFEFGRLWYYTGYSGRDARGGIRVRRYPGFAKKPYLGIVKRDKALGEVSEEITDRLMDAMVKEWRRLGFKGVF